MKGSNGLVTVCGLIAAVSGAMSQVPSLPEEWKFPIFLVAAIFGGGTAYFAKGKDVTGGSIPQ